MMVKMMSRGDCCDCGDCDADERVVFDDVVAVVVERWVRWRLMWRWRMMMVS